MTSKPFFSIHNHSRFSKNDAMGRVEEMVAEGVRLGWPGLGLTDHGMVAGNLALYKACRKAGIEPFPGMELYVTPDRSTKQQGHNLHLTVVAYSETGYRNLCRLTTLTAKNKYYLPRVDLADLAEMAEAGATTGLAVATGCWFGLLPTTIRNQGPEAGVALVNALNGWFPRVYVELQNHGIANEEQRGDAAWINEAGEQLGEDIMVSTLIDVSLRTGTPYIITNDAHYVTAEDQELHDGLKALCSWSEDPDDAVFPGGPYCLMSRDDLAMFFEPDVIDSACDTLADLAERASVRIPAIDNFKLLMPDVAKTDHPIDELVTLIDAGMERLVGEEPVARRKRRLERIEYELDIIADTGFATYLLLVSEVCRFMDEKGIVYNARGSANNSEVNYLLGITNVSAFDDDLIFERFISRDRIKPPDVDLDIEHERRDEVVEWASSRYTVAQVGTLMKYSLYDEEEGAAKGSLRARYFATAAKQGHKIAHTTEIPTAHLRLLKKLSELDLISGYGTHPAGLILAPDEATIADLPMTHIGTGRSGHLVTAYYKEDVEDLGFIKMDLLGLRTLTAVAVCTRLIMAETGQQLSPMEFVRTIPMNDAKVYSRMSKGQTEGIFQLQEAPATDFVRRMKPKNLKEVIASMALMRPAAKASDTAATYLARRRGVSKIPQMHDDIMAQTKKTFGTILYQEQVIGLGRALGMDMPELNVLLKAIKASNEYVAGAKVAIANALPHIHDLAAARQWGEADVSLLVDALQGYGDYGFNEGHADSYGRMAYWTGWMAENYPPHWWTGVLHSYAGTKSEDRYVKAARRYGVRVMPASVNISKVSYTYDQRQKAVRRGLVSIKGVGEVAAREIADKAPYASMVDFIQRVLPSRVSGVKALQMGQPIKEVGGVVKALDEYGAFDSLDWD